MYHLRFVECEENDAFMPEDGINVFSGSAAIKTCLICINTDLPSMVKEIVSPYVIAKRMESHSPIQLTYLTRNFL